MNKLALAINILWILAAITFLVNLLLLLVKKRNIFRRSTYSTLSLIYIIAVLLFANTTTNEVWQWNWDLNHFTRPDISQNTPNPLSDYAAEQKLISLPRPLNCEIISIKSAAYPYQDSLKEVVEKVNGNEFIFVFNRTNEAFGSYYPGWTLVEINFPGTPPKGFINP